MDYDYDPDPRGEDENFPEDFRDLDRSDDLFDIRCEARWDREAAERDMCPGPDEGDGESGPPARVEACCAKHFPAIFALRAKAENNDFGDDDIPF